MFSKKNKSILAVTLASAFAVEMIASGAVASAKVDPLDHKDGCDTTVENKYGDTTYADRFMSLYDDVITNGVKNGYMSEENQVSGGLGIPYHCAEEVNVEAPDYGHETTSEAMSYLVWSAAMHDHIIKAAASGEVKSEKGSYDGQSADLAKAWKTLQVMVPSFQGSRSYMGVSNVSATYSDEWEDPGLYPTAMKNGNTGSSPMHAKFCQVYGSDSGLYLMHWLADVDNWYGFGDDSENVAKGTKSFTFINTFQRGEEESCWETIPFGCVETLNTKYGMKYNGKNLGMKGFFDTNGQGPADVAAQWRYTNAPDAEDRAIQAVYEANLWGVGDSNVSQLAGKMGDQTREDMYDKYYKKIGCTNSGEGQDYTNGGKHYLMAWYTSWGGAMDNQWAWQIGASHAHEFYQNPLAAYALLEDSGLNGGMKASGATEDFQTSLVRQIEFYIWLQSNDGPFAGGATNSFEGRYLTPDSNLPKFYGMAYTEHPVYHDPGSNHWIGNQVWATQRLAELYYQLCNGGKDYKLTDGTSMKEAIGKMLDKWVKWFCDYTIIGTANGTKTVKYDYDKDTGLSADVPDLTQGVKDDGKSYSIPASLVWHGTPSKDYSDSKQENPDLTCEIVAYGNADVGCVSSLANTLLYYAKAKGVDSKYASDRSSYATADGKKVETTSENEGQAALYIAKSLIDRLWEDGRDEIGLSLPDHNGSLIRFWNGDGKSALALPNGSRKNGDGQVLPAYEGTMPNGDVIKDGDTFYDIRSNYKNIAKYNDLKAYYDKNGNTDDYELNYHRFWHEGDAMQALGVIATLYTDLTPGNTPEQPTTEPSTTTEEVTSTSSIPHDTVPEGTVTLWGDTNCDGVRNISDVVLLNKHVASGVELSPQGSVNANLDQSSDTEKSGLTASDSVDIMKLIIGLIKDEQLPITTK